MPEAAMIFAAGFGTRMRPLTDSLPKPLIPVAGRPLIDHALDRVTAAGIGRVVVNLHYRGDQIRAHLAGRARPRIAFSDESARILDTGGGLLAALPALGTGAAPVATLNSDALWTGPEPLPDLARAWDGARMGALLHLVPRARAVGYTRAGDFFRDDAGRLTRRGAAETAPYVFTGAQIIAPAALAGQAPGVFSLNAVWDQLLDAGRLFGIVHPGDWVDIGTPAGISAAEALLEGA